MCDVTGPDLSGEGPAKLCAGRRNGTRHLPRASASLARTTVGASTNRSSKQLSPSSHDHRLNDDHVLELIGRLPITSRRNYSRNIPAGFLFGGQRNIGASNE